MLGDGVYAEQERLKQALLENIALGDKMVEVFSKLGTGGGLGGAVNSQSQLVQLQKQANQASEESKRIKAEERELNRLIAEEERQRKKQAAADQRALNKEKADSDREYVASWKRNLAEREKEEKASNKRITDQAKRDAKARAEMVDPTSLKGMSKELEILRERYYRLSQAQRENANLGGVWISRIKELDEALKKADAEMGKHQRNVGNYASAYNGLGFAVRNIAGELPNLGISLRTFGQSISNNIGPLTEAIGNLRTQNKALAAEGKPTVSVGKQIAQSLFTWQTAALLVVVAGLKLIEMISKGSKATQEAEKANKKYAESLKSIEENQTTAAGTEIAKLNLLFKAATDRNSSLQKQKHAIDELKNGYPNYLGFLDKENVKTEATAEKVRDLTQAILANAAAQASAEKYGAAYNRVLDLERAVASAGRRYGRAFNADKTASARDSTAKANQDFSFAEAELGRDPSGEAASSASVEVKRAKRDFDQLREQLRKARVEMFGFAEDAQRAESQVPDLLTKPVKEKAAKRPIDMTSAELSAKGDEIEQFYRAAALSAQIEAETQKQIAEDDQNDIDARKEAFLKYMGERLNAVGYGYAAERDTIQASLDEIEKIEKISEEKRTATQKKLLLQKNGLELQQANLTKQFQLDANKAIGDIAEFNAKVTDEATARIKKNMDAVGAFFKGTPGQSSDPAKQLAKEQAAREMRENFAQKSIQIEQELLGIVIDSNRAKIAAIDAEIAKVKELGAIQRAEIENSGLSEQEQKEAIAALNAKLANDEFQLNEKKRAQQQKNARFEKAANVSLLIQETAIAVVRALGSKPFTPANIALAIGVGALGAANIARAIATPIPQYKDGTPIGGHKRDGLAIVGDGGRSEVVETSDGVFVTPAVSTPVFLRRGDKVHKSVEDYINRAQVMSMNGIPALRPIGESISMKKAESKLERIARGIDRLNAKEPVNLNLLGSGWNNYISDIYH